ncbi:MAG TPA: hypothetical protein VHM88_24375 [Candidatus Acidoferrales bacterium]|jgi:Tol biopolymer transport system component|nr:hypothetical protein [Candidatus Acidoferrales bacterium]
MVKKLIAIPLAFVLWDARPATAAKVTVDDLMRLRSISDVCISPDGKQVAYVVSTPSFETAAHEATLYVVPATGGKPLRLTYTSRIFNRPLPAPALRWSPDGSLLTFIGFVEGVPQVIAMSSAGGEAWPLTSVKEGVTTYEWSPDGEHLAFLAPNPASPEDEQRKKDKSFVIHVGRNERLPRLWVQEVRTKLPKAISPVNQFVVDFSWAPDGRTIVYSASNESGFYARYRTRIYAIPAAGGEPHTVVDRPGTNRAPQYSPDGRWIAFISSGGYDGMIAAQDLHVVSADGRPGTIKNLTAVKEAWIGEFIWAADSRSIFYIPNEQTSESGEHMFEQPIGRISLDKAAIDLVTPGPFVNFYMSLSKDCAKGTPYDIDGDGIVETRPLATKRNQFRGPASANIDLRVEKRFKFGERYVASALAEFFNLTNQANPKLINNSFISGAPGPQFGQVLVPLPGREVQFGLRFQF